MISIDKSDDRFIAARGAACRHSETYRSALLGSSTIPKLAQHGCISEASIAETLSSTRHHPKPQISNPKP